jgi:hypothetical protein
MKLKYFNLMLLIFISQYSLVEAADPQCTEAQYYAARPDVQQAGVPALTHYNNSGKNESFPGRCNPVLGSGSSSGTGDPECTEAQYYSARPDVQAAGVPALTHYNNGGKNESFPGRCNPVLDGGSSSGTGADPSGDPECTEAQYYSARPDVQAAGVPALTHYNNGGKNESFPGRCNPVLGGSGDDGGSNGGANSIVGKFSTGRWIYIDDMIQSLKCDLGGDTNASQDWVGSILLGAHYNSLPLFMGVTTTRPRNNGCGKHNGSPGPSLNVANQLSMGIPVYRGADGYNATGLAGNNSLAKKIIEQSKKGALKIVAGGPLTDIRVALRNGAVADNITVYCIGEWNREQAPTAYAEVKNKLGSRFQCYDHTKEYLSLIQTKTNPTGFTSKVAWIKSLFSINQEWQQANSNFVLDTNTRLNSSHPHSAGFRLADIMVTVRSFQGKGPAQDIVHVTNMIKRGAKLIQAKR